jgi:crotonobetainyl-CoA:carnitine CoA-transferase CaiB-like acyl-CoA transferase
MDEFEVWSKTLTVTELLPALERHSVPSAAYRTVREAMADPQLVHRQSLSEVRDAAGTLTVLNPPFRMTASETRAAPFAPALGEHTREVLRDAGVPDGVIAELTSG